MHRTTETKMPCAKALSAVPRYIQHEPYKVESQVVDST